MHRDHDIFVRAVKEKKKVLIKHHHENGRDVNTKVYCPLFYIPADGTNSSGHYYVLENGKDPKGNILGVKTENIIHIGQTQEPFDPIGLTLVSDEDLSFES